MNGQRIVVTRAPHQAAEFNTLLREQGAVPLAYPCIELVPPQNSAPLQSALDDLAAFDWLLLTSRNTVYALAQHLSVLPDGLKLGVVGASTAEALAETFGRTPDAMPESYTGAALAAALPALDGQHVLLPQSALADATLKDNLTAKNAQVTAVEAYAMQKGQGGEPIPMELYAGRVDALTFTSGSTVRYFVDRVGAAIHLVQALPCCCIGPSTWQTAQKAGFETVLMPPVYTLEAMVAELNRWFEEN